MSPLHRETPLAAVEEEVCLSVCLCAVCRSRSTLPCVGEGPPRGLRRLGFGLGGLGHLTLALLPRRFAGSYSSSYSEANAS